MFRFFDFGVGTFPKGHDVVDTKFNYSIDIQLFFTVRPSFLIFPFPHNTTIAAKAFYVHHGAGSRLSQQKVLACQEHGQSGESLDG